MRPATDISQLGNSGLGALALARGGSRWRLAEFYELTKPRMNFLVVLTTMVGFYMAVGGQHMMHWSLLLHTVIGTAATAAAASVLNQYSERQYDALMPRTAGRPIPAGSVAPLEALLMGVGLGVGGVIYLTIFVNPLTSLLGMVTLLSYVFVYTPLKRSTTLCTIVGAVPGAIPPVMGYTAAGGTLNVEALALFAILFLWQMPHFLAIAILYRDDYAAGGFKMLPVVDGDLSSTGRQIVLYGAALIPVSLMPVALHMAGAIYLAAAVLLGAIFLNYGVVCAMLRRRLDARRLFLVSIIYLPLLFSALMVDKR